jgi:short-subunit dehydrogenase
MSVTLITGASSGLGAEMARQLAAHGEDLALCARRTDRLEGLKAEILAANPGRRVELRALDVTDDDAVFEVFRAFQADFGDITVSTIYPGYIRSEMNEKVAQKTRFMVDTKTGVTAIVDAIEKGSETARVPAWPWRPLGTAMRHLPLSVVRKMT